MLTVPTGYTRNFSPAIGAGQADLQGTFSYGLSLYPLPAYAQAYLGYRHRSEVYAFSGTTNCAAGENTCIEDIQPDYGDEWLFGAEVGVSLDRWALVQALVQGTWSNTPPETNFDPSNPFPTHARYVKTGAGLTVYPLRDVGLSVQVFTTPYGRNTVRSTDWFWGIEYRVRPRASV